VHAFFPAVIGFTPVFPLFTNHLESLENIIAASVSKTRAWLTVGIEGIPNE
jgi:hypothetical protein